MLSKICLSQKSISFYLVTGATLVDSLTGVDTRPYLAFEGKILNEECLLADAIHSNNHSLMEAIYTGRFISAFWKGQYAEANKWYDLASELKLFSMIKIRVLHCTFYRGLVAFQLYRDGQGEDWLDEGKRILTKVEGWSRNCCTSLFENKLHLLRAENFASDGNIARAKKSYELSVALAGDVGLVHEQGLAAEYYGKFLSSIVEFDEANVWLLRAHSVSMHDMFSLLSCDDVMPYSLYVFFSFLVCISSSKSSAILNGVHLLKLTK